MSESIYCVLCHQVVWFGAYGTCKRYIKFKLHDVYEYYSPVCEECLNLLNRLPTEKIEEEE